MPEKKDSYKESNYVKKYLPILIILILAVGVKAQSLTGMTGYFTIPSADIIEDSHINIGASFINKKYLEYTSFQKDVAALFLTFGFIPNVEISGRFTRVLKFVGESHNVDRVASAKIKFFNEGKYSPSFAVGLHNPFSGLVDANHFNSTYFVVTKNIVVSSFFSLGLTAGQGFDWIEAADQQFVGTFGGLLVKYGNERNSFEVMIDNDAERWNGGVRVKLFGFISLMGGAQGFDVFSGTGSIHFSL